MTILVALLIAVVVSPLVVKVASQRAFAQPLLAPVEEERDVIAGIVKDPMRFFTVALLRAELFCLPVHREIFAALEDRTFLSQDPVKIAEAEAAGAEPRELTCSPAELWQSLYEQFDGTAACALLEELAQRADQGEKAFLASAEKVLAAGEDRLTYPGALAIVDNPQGGIEAPLRRVGDPWSLKRVVLTAGWLWLALLTAGILTPDNGSRAALLVLIAGCAVLSWVDIDTMYIDHVTLAVTVLGAWAFAVPYAHTQGGWVQVGLAGFTTAVVVGLLEALVYVHRRLRGAAGLGGGDSLLLIATLSVPLLVTDQTIVAIWGVFASAAMALVSRLVLVAFGRTSLRAPFAFGPFIAIGWLVGWLLFHLTA